MRSWFVGRAACIGEFKVEIEYEGTYDAFRVAVAVLKILSDVENVRLLRDDGTVWMKYEPRKGWSFSDERGA